MPTTWKINQACKKTFPLLNQSNQEKKQLILKCHDDCLIRFKDQSNKNTRVKIPRVKREMEETKPHELEERIEELPKVPKPKKPKKEEHIDQLPSTLQYMEMKESNRQTLEKLTELQKLVKTVAKKQDAMEKDMHDQLQRFPKLEDIQKCLDSNYTRISQEVLADKNKNLETILEMVLNAKK